MIHEDFLPKYYLKEPKIISYPITVSGSIKIKLVELNLNQM